MLRPWYAGTPPVRLQHALNFCLIHCRSIVFLTPARRYARYGSFTPPAKKEIPNPSTALPRLISFLSEALNG